MVVLTLGQIEQALADHQPRLVAAGGRRRAAVAMVLRTAPAPRGGPEVLFIERARRSGDPWSGHMAFPGGRLESGDPDPRSAAERETREEVGLDLQGARLLGRLDDMEGRNAAAPQLVISGFVYSMPDPDPLSLNHEVREALWFPLGELHRPSRHVEYDVHAAHIGTLPGILVGEPGRHIVWGLTYRFLEVFFQVVAHPLPDRYDPTEALSASSAKQGQPATER